MPGAATQTNKPSYANKRTPTIPSPQSPDAQEQVRLISSATTSQLTSTLSLILEIHNIKRENILIEVMDLQFTCQAKEELSVLAEILYQDKTKLWDELSPCRVGIKIVAERCISKGNGSKSYRQRSVFL